MPTVTLHPPKFRDFVWFVNYDNSGVLTPSQYVIDRVDKIHLWLVGRELKENVDYYFSIKCSVERIESAGQLRRLPHGISFKSTENELAFKLKFGC